MKQVTRFLLGIDIQQDFCNPNGSLFVPNADNDCKRLAKMINRVGRKFTDVIMTLDSHHYIAIFHPNFWQDGNGGVVQPFTPITNADIKAGKFRPRNIAMMDWVLKYTEELEAQGKFTLFIWPEHCIVGTKGHNIEENIEEELRRWEVDNFANVTYAVKGLHPLTEMYSVFRAEVPINTDTTTMLNTSLLNMLFEADEIVIAGQALSHCVANSIRDITNNFGNDAAKKFIILTDATSNVPGFENAGQAFLDDMKNWGATLITTDAYLA